MSRPTSRNSSQATSWLWSLYPRNLAEAFVLFWAALVVRLHIIRNCQVKARIWGQRGQRAILLFLGSQGVLERKDG